jgi:hypothetical protein
MKMRGPYLAVSTEQGGALENIAKLPDVPRPGIVLKFLHRGGGELNFGVF